MPPPTAMPSNLIIAAVTAFRNLVNNLQNTQDAGLQARQTAASLGEAANAMDLIASSIALHENQIQTAQTTADDVKTRVNQSTQNSARKPLCESRSVANLKTLGSKKEEFKNWNEK